MIVKNKYMKGYKANGRIFFMTDNYGHHSCSAILTSVAEQEWDEFFRCEPREETQDFNSLAPWGDEEFEKAWKTHCKECDETARFHIAAMEYYYNQ